VLDPFNGTGTTGAVAKHLGRRYIGIERDPAYAAAAEKRIAAGDAARSADAGAVHDRARAPRVPFAALLERGLVTAGRQARRRQEAAQGLVRADGAVSLGDQVGSIHRIGALAQGSKPATAGPSGISKRRRGSISIDALRAEIRAEMAEA
jgi:modification methylase